MDFAIGTKLFGTPTIARRTRSFWSARFGSKLNSVSHPHRAEMLESVIVSESEPLPIRLVVGHQTLDLGARVRILHRQPTNPEDAASSHVLAPLRWPVRLVAQDTALSRLKQGFDSPTGYQSP